MKSFFSVIIIIFSVTLSFGQGDYNDIVYLKNGSIIRGVIIEQVPNESIKIKTIDGNVFVFQLSEIDKITKDYKKVINNVDSRKGYIAISGGYSIPIGEFGSNLIGSVPEASKGFQLNLINFGYRFSRNLGVSAVFFGALNPVDDSYVEENWYYGGLVVGPLISFPFSKRAELDFRPMIGYSQTTIPNFGNGRTIASTFAVNFGTALRVNVGNNMALLISADYFSTTLEDVFELPPYNSSITLNISTVSLGFGVVYRIK